MFYVICNKPYPLGMVVQLYVTAYSELLRRVASRWGVTYVDDCLLT